MTRWDASLFELGGGQWDIAELRRLVSEIIPRSAAVVGYEVTAEFPAIGRRTMLVSARRLVHPDNNSTSILILFEDVSEQRQADAQKDILLAETRHRMKNLLGIVRSLAYQTEVEGRSAEDYRDAFVGRFQAVAEAENLALASNAPAELSTLVQQALSSAGPQRYRVDPGPPVHLRRHQIMPLSLVLHELVTNAWKYGAFSRPAGGVHVSWRTAEREGKPVVELDWKKVVCPFRATRSGFGSKLIGLSVAQGLRGTMELKYEPSGLGVHITFALE